MSAKTTKINKVAHNSQTKFFSPKPNMVFLVLRSKSVEVALRHEEHFLKEKYPDLADRNGSTYLAKMLQTLLIRHIKTCLPDVKDAFLKRIEECRSILEKCGTKVTDEKVSLHDMIGTFSTEFQNMMSGGYVDLESVDLAGGSKLCHFFKNLESEFNSVDPCKKYGNEQVILAIHQTSGPEPPVIFSERAFESLMRPLIKTMRLPSMLCVQNVAQELKEVCQKCLPKEVSSRFPKAIKAMSSVVNEMIDKLSESTQEFVNQTIDIEEGHITHSHFLKFGNESIQKILKKDSRDVKMPFSGKTALKRKSDFQSEHILKPSIQDQKQVEIIGAMLQYYYEVVANRICDTVIKATMTYFVNGLQKNIQLELATQLGNMVEKLFKEDHNVTLLRSQKEKEFQALRNSLKELDNLDYKMVDQLNL